MIFKILIIIFYIPLCPNNVRTIHIYLNTPSTKTFFDCPQFEISDPWDSITEEEYVKDILEDSCKDTDCSDYELRTFDIFGNKADDYIGH